MNHSSNQIAHSFTVSESCTIAKTFFLNLWPLVSSQADADKRSSLSKVFNHISLNQRDDPKWNEAVYRLTSIASEGQQAIHLFPSLVFECVIKFCELQDSRYSALLNPIVHLLKSMREHPSNHHLEWTLWEKSIQQAQSK